MLPVNKFSEKSSRPIESMTGQSTAHATAKGPYNKQWLAYSVQEYQEFLLGLFPSTSSCIRKWKRLEEVMSVHSPPAKEWLPTINIGLPGRVTAVLPIIPSSVGMEPVKPHVSTSNTPAGE